MAFRPYNPRSLLLDASIVALAGAALILSLTQSVPSPHTASATPGQTQHLMQTQPAEPADNSGR